MAIRRMNRMAMVQNWPISLVSKARFSLVCVWLIFLAVRSISLSIS
jgi:hypothetical protein